MSALTWLLGRGSARAGDASCLGCHADPAKEFSASAHAQAALTCVNCHGGDASATDESAHATDNFKRSDDKRAIAELCASCHSDVRKMNPYGLPADQLERYKTSRHGEQLFQHGDQNVATCTDCHGVHDIVKVTALQSRTHPGNIPQTCGRCHGDERLMSQYTLPHDVVSQYKSSHHAALLYEKGDASAPTCVTCHGNHGAMPPGVAEVGQVCGKCHGRQRELFEKSPHAYAAKAGAFNECVACHGNHAIRKASVDLFAAACTQCHADEAKPLGIRDALVALIRRAQDDFAPVVSYVWPAQKRGPSVQTVPAGKESDFAEWQSRIVAVAGHPVIVVRTPQGFRAFSAICTHLGCIVGWDAGRKQIACPCHAGFFDVNGRVVSGPPPRALTEHGVVVVNGEVLVKSA